MMQELDVDREGVRSDRPTACSTDQRGQDPGEPRSWRDGIPGRMVHVSGPRQGTRRRHIASRSSSPMDTLSSNA